MLIATAQIEGTVTGGNQCETGVKLRPSVRRDRQSNDVDEDNDLIIFLITPCYSTLHVESADMSYVVLRTVELREHP